MLDCWYIVKYGPNYSSVQKLRSVDWPDGVPKFFDRREAQGLAVAVALDEGWSAYDLFRGIDELFAAGYRV
jgi:hypothetical protein